MKSLTLFVTLFLAAATAQAEFKDFTVNGVKVTAAQQQAQAKGLMAARHVDKITDEIEADVRRHMTRLAAVAADARKKGLDKTRDVQADLANAQTIVLYNSALADFMEKHKVSDDAVKTVYDEERRVWGETEYAISHILVKEERDAKDLIAKIRSGADFKKLAAKESLDEDTKDTGGSLGWQSASVFGADFRSEVEGLGKGQVAARPLQSGAGWHVIYVTDTRPAQDFPSLEDRKKEITELIEQKMLQQYVEDLEKNAKVK